MPADKRELLGEAFALALLDRDVAAAPEQVEAARRKAYRAPLLMLAVARIGCDAPEVPAIERLVSLGAAIQNVLLAAHSMGFGSGLTSGKALGSARIRDLFSLAEGELPVCFINIGTISSGKPPRPRPSPTDFCSTL